MISKIQSTADEQIIDMCTWRDELIRLNCGEAAAHINNLKNTANMLDLEGMFNDISAIHSACEYIRDATLAIKRINVIQ